MTTIARCLPLIAASAAVALSASAAAPAILKDEFIYETAPFKSAHASTIVEPREGGLVAAFFGGTAEKNPDVGIHVCRLVDGQWTAPVEVANGVQPDGKRFPCWNPVLFQPKDGALMLFYKVGPSPSKWWGLLRTSTDGGKSWSDARKLPDGILGPIKNKPVQLADGTILLPTSTEDSPEEPKWRAHFERSTDGGATWTRGENLAGPYNIIQPSVLFHSGGKLQAVGRSKEKKIFESWSEDGGKSWSPAALTALPNPNSGIDAVTLADGRQALIYNHTPSGRSPLNLAISRDGKTWDAALVLVEDKGEYSYPAIIQTRDGLLHATFTWKREKVRHVVIDPAKLETRPMVDGQWPK